MKEARRVNGEGFPPGALDWLRMRFDADCQRFSTLLGDNPFFHGATPDVGDCAIWGYTQWLPEAGVDATPSVQKWLDRMRNHTAMKSPARFFPNHD
jgi:glutathione S-transferase